MDELIRIAAFEWLEKQVAIYNDILPRKILEEGFVFRNERITLVGPQGIWKPRQMNLPISITTTVDSQYDDGPIKNNFFQYKYRGINPNHRDNSGLREIMKKQVPLIYFLSISKGKYKANWPAYIYGDDKLNLTFTVAIDEMEIPSLGLVKEEEITYQRRAYITSKIKQRLHQQSFRERVLSAYQNQCTFCKLKHTELLDAAHIIPDSKESGIPIIQNGLSLCKIHHAAFDNNIIGVNPDYNIEVREDVLEEIDGPMLKHGIQSFNKSRLILPKRKIDWPDRDRLDERYQQFKKAI